MGCREIEILVCQFKRKLTLSISSRLLKRDKLTPHELSSLDRTAASLSRAQSIILGSYGQTYDLAYPHGYDTNYWARRKMEFHAKSHLFKSVVLQSLASNAVAIWPYASSTSPTKLHGRLLWLGPHNDAPVGHARAEYGHASHEKPLYCPQSG